MHKIALRIDQKAKIYVFPVGTCPRPLLRDHASYTECALHTAVPSLEQGPYLNI